MRKPSLNLLVLGLLSTAIYGNAFAGCASAPTKTADGTIISVSIPFPVETPPLELSAIPTIDVKLSAQKCSAISVSATMIQNSYAYDSTYVGHSFVVELAKDPADPCHFSAVSPTALDLEDGEEVKQEIALRVAYNDNANDWLSTIADPWHPEVPTSHNFYYRLSPNSTPAQGQFCPDSN